MFTQAVPRKLRSLRQILGPEPPLAKLGLEPGRTDTKTLSFSKLVHHSVAAAALSTILLSVSGGSGHAQQGPFSGLAGSWSGGGTLTLSAGSRERVQCRASYSVRSGGSDLDLSLRCAGDSYNFNFLGNARHRGGIISGSWSEATMGTSGRFIGRASIDRIRARVQGGNFTASLNITTRGNRQAISIRSPGSQFSDVSIALRRR
jgi:hypothetical protein